MIPVLIFTVAVIFLLSSILFPRKIFFLMLFFIILWPDLIFYKYNDFPGITPTRIMIFVLSVAFIINVLLLNEKTIVIWDQIKKNRKIKYILTLIIIFFFVQFSSSLLMSSNIFKSLYAFFNNFISGFLLLLFILFFFNTSKDIRKIFNFLFLCALVVNLVALYEYISGDSVFSNFLLTQNEFNVKAVLIQSRSGIHRLKSVFSNTLIYAQYMVSMIPIAIFLLKNEKKKFFRFIITLYLLSNVFFVFQTDSRTGMGLIVLIPLVILIFKFFQKIENMFKRNVIYSIIIGVILLSVFLIAVNADYALEYSELNPISEKDKSTIHRIRQFELAMKQIPGSPLIGYGAGEGVNCVAPYTTIDSFYLSLLLEVGILGLLVFVVFNIKLLDLFLSGSGDILSEKFYLAVSISIMLMFYFILSLDKMNSIYFILIGMGMSMILNTEKAETR